MDDSARLRLLASQPCERMQAFARALGWNDLRIHAIQWPKSPTGFDVAYWTTDERFNLQIGQRLDLGPNHYAATVIAERYGITAVPHQSFQLFDEPASFLTEAGRLFPLLGRTNFKNPAWRRQFAEQYPVWMMRCYRRRNKFLNYQRDRAARIVVEMQSQALLARSRS